MDISPLTVFILLSLQNLSECRAGIKYGDHKVHQTGHQRPRILPKTSYCSYNNRTYEAGEKFSPDPCTFCHCPRHSNRIQCAIQDCRYKSNCVRYNKLQGQCCGQCVEIGCKHSDGNIYNPNQTVVSNKCEICKCPPSGGRVECNQIKCPTINCVDPVKIEGECCEKCPNGICLNTNIILCVVTSTLVVLSFGCLFSDQPSSYCQSSHITFYNLTFYLF